MRSADDHGDMRIDLLRYPRDDAGGCGVLRFHRDADDGALAFANHVGNLRPDRRARIAQKFLRAMKTFVRHVLDLHPFALRREVCIVHLDFPIRIAENRFGEIPQAKRIAIE